VFAGDTQAGWLGELHPSVAAEWDLEGVAGFELDFGLLAGAATAVPRYEDLTSFPAIRRDLALTVPVGVSSDRVIDVIRKSAGERLARIEIFDVYEGRQAGENRKSLAMHLEFRAEDRTLTDEDARAIVDKILSDALSAVGAGHRA
jgi:phenylalanyl-tRNA synthetase beta chain